MIPQIYYQHFSDFQFKELQRKRQDIQMWLHYKIRVMKNNFCNFIQTILFSPVIGSEIAVCLSVYDLFLSVNCTPCFHKKKYHTGNWIIFFKFAFFVRCYQQGIGLQSNYEQNDGKSCSTVIEATLLMENVQVDRNK